MASMIHTAVSATPARTAPRVITSGRGHTFGLYLGHLLRRSSRGTLIWTISLAAYSAVIVAAFPSVRDSTDISTYPEAMQKAFGMTSLSVIEPFLTAEIFSYLPLVLAFLPILIFGSALAGAEERGSLDVLLGTPLPRRQLVLTTFLTAAINLAVVLGGLAVTLWGVSLAVDADLAFTDALAGSFAAWAAALALGTVAMPLSAMARQRSRVLGWSIGLMFAMYVLFVVSKLVERLDWLKWLSAFHYYGTAIEDGVYWLGAGVLLLAIAGLVALAVRSFERRDIYA